MFGTPLPVRLTIGVMDPTCAQLDELLFDARQFIRNTEKGRSLLLDVDHLTHIELRVGTEARERNDPLERAPLATSGEHDNRIVARHSEQADAVVVLGLEVPANLTVLIANFAEKETQVLEFAVTKYFNHERGLPPHDRTDLDMVIPIFAGFDKHEARKTKLGLFDNGCRHVTLLFVYVGIELSN